jgi:hypothetical protein
MSQIEFSDIIDLIYAAARGEAAAWSDLESPLCALFRSQRVSLGVPDASGMLRFVLGGNNELADAYSTYYHRLDPYRRVTHCAFPLRKPRSLSATRWSLTTNCSNPSSTPITRARSGFVI